MSLEPTPILEDNINIELKILGWDMEWIYIAEDRDYVTTVMTLQAALSSENFWRSRASISFSPRTQLHADTVVRPISITSSS